MPLAGTGDTLGALIKTNIESQLTGIIDDAKLAKICNAIGEAVVAHIVANGLVNGVVESGAGAGGTVTGTVE